MAKKISPRQKLIDSAFTLAAGQPWHQISLGNIADHAGVPLIDAIHEFRDKNAILDAAIADVNEHALAECNTFTEDDTIRDRLFALLMARLDAMEPYKAGGANVLRGVTSDPVTFLFRLPRIMTAMAKMLEAAGVDSSGLCGALRTKGLALVFVSTVRVWLTDDSADLAPTMAELDKNLGRADMMARQFWPPSKSTE